MSITITKTWVDGEQLTAADLNATFQEVATALPAASQSDVNSGVASTVGLVPSHNLIIFGTEVATTSGTAVAFPSIPSGVRRIVINFVGVSTSGTNDLILTLGDAGGLETSGYLGACTTIAGATPSTSNYTAAFGLSDAVTAASVIHGSVTLNLEDAADFTWCCTSVLAYSNAATVSIGAGSKSLSAILTQLSITTVGGTDTFDAGVINISYAR